MQRRLDVLAPVLARRSTPVLKRRAALNRIQIAFGMTSVILSAFFNPNTNHFKLLF